MSVLMQCERAQALVIDIQEKLLPAMSEAQEALGNSVRLVQAAARLSLPVTVSQQYPRGIGATVEDLRRHLPNDCVTLDKMAFSCMRDDALRQRIEQLAADGRDQVVVWGIETHVCVLQTALEVVAAGLRCFVVADATASRTPASKELALSRMQAGGVNVVTTEMAIFEWLAMAGTPDFKALLPLVK
ncbi:MAG: isochorismatase family protein [Beijerinckiaceae bacterium]|nr:isochorismatase family protein [Beijerinckiaceae bacterium]